MSPTPHDIYQLAGVDPRERGFSRPVDITAEGREYLAILRYEEARVAGKPAASQDAAVEQLIVILQAQGYRQLKTQMSFRNGAYLGSREAWTEYADPPPQRSVFAAVRSWFQRHTLSA